MPQFTIPPPTIKDDIVRISFPADHVLHVAMNRPKQYNAMSASLNDALTEVFDWFEAEPTLWVAIMGSTQKKAFCAGADLKAWMTEGKMKPTRAGFAGMSERFTKKPIIGAINGITFGGGCEIVANLDMAVAGETTVFGYPEAKRGVSIASGGVPRFVRLVGHQKAAELMLTGRVIPAKEALELKMVNYVVPDDEVEAKALELATTIAANSPDSVMSLLYGIRLSSEVGSLQHAQRMFVDSAQLAMVYSGDNMKEGMKAFAEKRAPKWVPSKL